MWRGLPRASTPAVGVVPAAVRAAPLTSLRQLSECLEIRRLVPRLGWLIVAGGVSFAWIMGAGP